MGDSGVSRAEQASVLHDELRLRARRLRRSAAWILTLIVAVLLVGIGVFIAAGTLASRETTSVVDQNRKALLDSFQRQRAPIDKELTRLENLVSKKRGQISEEMSQAYGQTESTKRLTLEVADLEQSHQNLETQRTEIDRNITLLGTTAPKATSREAQLAALISAISTRIGAIVLLLFLVQILVPLYRCNSKLAAHYDACADVFGLLLLSDPSVPMDLFVRILAAVSPAGVEFGIAPAPPTEQAFRAIAEALSRK